MCEDTESIYVLASTENVLLTFSAIWEIPNPTILERKKKNYENKKYKD